MLVQNSVPLFPYTTLQLGGLARYYVQIKTKEDLVSALEFSKKESLPYFVLGGGSNTIFLDKGFDGLVIHMMIPGIRCLEVTDSEVIYSVGAGVPWDEFVDFTTKQGLAGLETLSGIPGSVGASPIQNIGAYGKEVKDSIISVEVLETSGQFQKIFNEQCGFTYRNSVFKSGNKKDSIIVSVTFKLSKIDSPCFRYPEVENYKEAIYASVEQKGNKLSQNIDSDSKLDLEMFSSEDRILLFTEFRNTILNLRKRKSMVLDENDPNTRSVGSFFTNPILSESQTELFLHRLDELGMEPPTLYPESEGKTKISAAWLIENAGIKKGTKFEGGVGVSENHCLALVNFSGSTEALLSMASLIREKVAEKFLIKLEREPVLCP